MGNNRNSCTILSRLNAMRTIVVISFLCACTFSFAQEATSAQQKADAKEENQLYEMINACLASYMDHFDSGSNNGMWYICVDEFPYMLPMSKEMQKKKIRTFSMRHRPWLEKEFKGKRKYKCLFLTETQLEQN
jgi:hypothetical protein